MKKTLIAAAIATVAAAPAAMADVSISGQVKVTVADNDGQEGDYAPSYDNSLTFKASEDLGNGMSAFAQISLDTDSVTNDADDSTNDDTGVTVNKDQKVGLKGSFGTIVAGRMETLTQGSVSTMMDDGGGNGNLETALTNLGRYNAVAYLSPAMNGFTVGVAGTMEGDNGTSGDDDDDGLFRHMDYMVAYANGPLAVKAAFADLDGDNTAADYDITSIGAAYTIGDAKVSVLSVDKDTSTTDDHDMMYRVDYSMGNNSLLLGHIDDDTANSDITSIKLTHKMSKRTAVWVGHRDKGSAITNGDTTHFGIIHKF